MKWAKENKVRLKRGDFVQHTKSGLCAVCLLTAAYCAANNKTWEQVAEETFDNDCADDDNPIYRWAHKFGHVYHFKPAFIPKAVWDKHSLADAVIKLFDGYNWTSTRIVKWLKGMVPA